MCNSYLAEKSRPGDYRVEVAGEAAAAV